MKRSLKFFESDIELDYLSKLKDYQLLYLKILFVLTLTISNISWFLNPLSLDRFGGAALIFNLAINFFFLTIIILFFLYNKKFKYPEYAIYAIQYLLVVITIESSEPLTLQNEMQILIFLRGITVEYLLLFPMFSRCSWISNLITCLILTIYLNIRAYKIFLFEILMGYPNSIFLVNFLFIFLGSYFNEKLDRQHFFQRKKIESSLIRFENMIKDVLPNGIMIMRKGNVVFNNEQTRRLLSIKGSEDIFKRIDNIYIEKKDNFNSYDDTLPLKSGDKSLSDILKDKTSSLIHSTGFQSYTGLISQNEISNEIEATLDIKIGKIDWEGQEAIIILLSEDLMSQKLNVLKHQGKYKDKLLATVSHELRTPLNGVIGVLDLVLETNLDPNIKKSLILAHRSSYLLLYMINDILDNTQITEGKLRLNEIYFHPIEILKEVKKLLKIQAKNKGVALEILDLTTLYHPNLKIKNDPQRLKQVLLNLLNNALKYTENGRIVLSIEMDLGEGGTRLFISPKEERSVLFRVIDTGCGIKPEDLPKLLKVFGKLEVHRNNDDNQIEVGLGLAISQNLVQQMNKNSPGDDIKVESVYGKGSTFSFKLLSHNDEPCDRNINDAITYPALSRDLTPYFLEKMHNKEPRPKLIPDFLAGPNVMSTKKKKIKALLVDDDQINILVLKNFFNTFADYEYDVAFNGKQAIDLVSSQALENKFYDVILMDCNMPIIDGFEATRCIKTKITNKEIPDLKIIAATANVSPVDYNNCFDAGMNDHISKPFTVKQLREVLDRNLKK